MLGIERADMGSNVAQLGGFAATASASEDTMEREEQDPLAGEVGSGGVEAVSEAGLQSLASMTAREAGGKKMSPNVK